MLQLLYMQFWLKVSNFDAIHLINIYLVSIFTVNVVILHLSFSFNFALWLISSLGSSVLLTKLYIAAMQLRFVFKACEEDLDNVLNDWYTQICTLKQYFALGFYLW